jgi:hypothetical protein
MKLILEFTEFTAQQFSNQPLNKQTSLNAFDKYENDKLTSNARLNDILSDVKFSDINNNVTNIDISELKIIKMKVNNSIDLDVYITFVLDEEEYYGKITNLKTNPIINLGVFNKLYFDKETKIRLKGLILKTIKQWFNISPSYWNALKEIKALEISTGIEVIIPKGGKIYVLRSLTDSIQIKYNEMICELSNLNYYYFNYWFEQ